MTVELRVDQLLLCSWFNGYGRICRATFAPRELQPAPVRSPVWLKAIARLSARWPVVATPI